jgi:hypothetical protein
MKKYRGKRPSPSLSATEVNVGTRITCPYSKKC